MKQDVLNPMTWDKEQWRDAALGVAVTTLIFIEVLSVIIFIN